MKFAEPIWLCDWRDRLRLLLWLYRVSRDRRAALRRFASEHLLIN